MSLEVTIYKAMDKKNIEEVCLEAMGNLVILEKGMDMISEVKVCKVTQVGEMIAEVMGKSFEAMGKMIIEVMCLELVDFEVLSFGMKGKMFLEVMDLKMNIEMAINEAKKSFEEKGNEVVIHEELMGKARTHKESSFGKKGIERLILEEMGLMMIFVAKGLELTNEEMGKEKEKEGKKENINEAKGQDEYWPCLERPPRSSMC